MSVAYEPRTFINEGAYPSMGDETTHTPERRYTDNDVAEQLSQYTAGASIIHDDRGILGNDRGMIPEDSTVAHAAPPLELGPNSFPSPIRETSQPRIVERLPRRKVTTPTVESPPTTSKKSIFKPEREVQRGPDGKYHCTLDVCTEEVSIFARKCEYNKHMDKHERPYRCTVPGCEILPGFTYSGGLLRHEREVHGKHGGPKNMINCPHPNCKRHAGKGFSRQENLNEHLRRVHTGLAGPTFAERIYPEKPNPERAYPERTYPERTYPERSVSPIAATTIEGILSPDDASSERSGRKRKRRLSGTDDRMMEGELIELRGQVKRLKEENEQLKIAMERYTQQSLSMMARIADLQATLQQGLTPERVGAPTAQMI